MFRLFTEEAKVFISLRVVELSQHVKVFVLFMFNAEIRQNDKGLNLCSVFSPSLVLSLCVTI